MGCFFNLFHLLTHPRWVYGLRTVPYPSMSSGHCFYDVASAFFMLSRHSDRRHVIERTQSTFLPTGRTLLPSLGTLCAWYFYNELSMLPCVFSVSKVSRFFR